jgi:glutamate:Na+ symporter, ESS family
MFEREGVAGATSIAVASATFGIAVAGLLAGRVGQFLVSRIAGREVSSQDSLAVDNPLTGELLPHGLTICLCIGLGSFISWGLQAVGITVPAFIGPMTVAAIWRNVNDRFEWQALSESKLREVFQVTLPLFIGVAISALKLWELTALALPLVLLLCSQVALTVVLSIGSFYAMRRVTPAYEAAVISAGFTGFMLGITPNAMASMEELTSKNGDAPQAFLTVPIVGGYLNDFVNSFVITVSIGVLRLLH